ncbi:MAG: GFA family protein, partial [Burkholderiales bacterium]
MAKSREGGCVCGAVRYRVKAAPVRASICHCRNCQRRTGSAFGIGAYFKEQDVEILQGDLRTYEYRSDETGRWLRTQFCASCGSTLTWTAEALTGLRAIA